MTEAEIFRELTGIFRDIFMDEALELSADTTVAQIPSWDSMKYVEILMAIQETFAIKMQTREIDQIRNMGDFVRVIAEKKAGAR